MTDSCSPARARLYALLGDAMHDLSPRFVTRLERILEAQQEEGCVPDRVVDIMQARQCSMKNGQPEGARRAAARRHDEAASISRKLAGLSSIVQILDAAHHCREDATNQPVLGVQMVQGLLVAGRALLDAVDKRVCRAR